MTKLKNQKCLAFQYSNESATDDANSLEKLLTENAIDFVRYDDGIAQRFIINKSGKTFESIMAIVNSVHSVKFRYKSTCVNNGHEYCLC